MLWLLTATASSAATATSSPALGAVVAFGLTEVFAAPRWLVFDWRRSLRVCGFRLNREARFPFLALPVAATAVTDFAGLLVGAAGCGLLEFVRLFLVFEFEEVRYVEERIAFQPDIDECRLHAGQYAGNAAVIDRTGQSIFVFAFVIDFRELIVF